MVAIKLVLATSSSLKRVIEILTPIAILLHLALHQNYFFCKVFPVVHYLKRLDFHFFKEAKNKSFQKQFL